MNSLTAPVPTDPKKLLPLLHQRLDDASAEEISAVHRFLLRLEAHRLADELGSGLQADWESGRITQDSIAAAVAEHRARHPYRR